MSDFTNTVNNNSDGSRASKDLIHCLKSVSKALSHTDEAAKRARFQMESLQHNFGLGGIFLTVTPDDENCFLVAAYSQIDQNREPIDVTSLSDQNLKARAKLLVYVRIKYPGTLNSF